MKIAIIGGGASGLICASYLKRNNSHIDITIYEKNKGLGRKILASGNGKCNFMNYKAHSGDYNNPSFVEKIFAKANKEDVLNYFASIGLLFKFDDEGRMYPQSESSETILNLLVDDIGSVNLKLETEVFKITYLEDKIIINNTDIYDYAVLATGSVAGLISKKMTNVYDYYKDLNLKFVDERPVLVGMKCQNDIKELQGYRAKCKISYEGTELYQEKGEIIFKDGGVSGICVMNASRFFKKPSKLKIDLYPLSSREEIEFAIKSRMNQKNDLKYYLEGICHPKMISYLKKAKITDYKQIATILKNFTLDIVDTYSMTEAQAARGGISLEELNDNLELKRYPHLYVTGEAMDIDGKCGGYNLLYAFVCGILVAKELQKNENKN